MPIPEFVRELRSAVGTSPLWLTGVTAVVLDPSGSRVLMTHRVADSLWAPVGGILEPGEDPADAVVRECLEETAVRVLPERLTSVTVNQPVVHSNGDRAQYLTLTFRARWLSGEPRVNDDESYDVAWVPLDALPPNVSPGARRRLLLALEDRAEAHFDLDPQYAEQTADPAGATADPAR